jgi:hypothetical protein
LVRHTPDLVAWHTSLKAVRLQNQWPARELSVLEAANTNAAQTFAICGDDFESTVLRNQSRVLK